jgi:glucose-6-phosphate isomerase, archaeal
MKLSLSHEMISFNEVYWYYHHPPANPGGEFVKTKGHYHPANPAGAGFPERYEGVAHVLLQKKTLDHIVLVKAAKGDIVLLPPAYGHVTINPSRDETLIMANCFTSIAIIIFYT